MGEVFVKFHVIADPDGELLAWIRAARATDSGPRLIVIPENPTHVLHENVEVDEGTDDRATLVATLQKRWQTDWGVEGRHPPRLRVSTPPMKRTGREHSLPGPVDD
jgi:hypothetical protein